MLLKSGLWGTSSDSSFAQEELDMLLVVFVYVCLEVCAVCAYVSLTDVNLHQVKTVSYSLEQNLD